MNDVVYEYLGYQYVPLEVFEEDNVKVFHEVLTPDGDKICMDRSPYAQVTADDFKTWVDRYRLDLFRSHR